MPEVPVRISLSAGRGEILVDGHDIARAIQSVKIECDASDIGRARLTLDLPTLEWGSDKTSVLFVDDVHDALVAMGWTPPVGDV